MTPPVCQWHGRWMAPPAGQRWLSKTNESRTHQSEIGRPCRPRGGGGRVICYRFEFITRTDGNISGVKVQRTSSVWTGPIWYVQCAMRGNGGAMFFSLLLKEKWWIQHVSHCNTRNWNSRIRLCSQVFHVKGHATAGTASPLPSPTCSTSS